MTDIPKSDHVVRFFDAHVNRYGATPSGVGWSSAFSQSLRFNVLSQIADWNGQQVLDVGCGYGALFGYFVEQGLCAGYYGIDVSPSMIEMARKTYPDGSFGLADFFDPAFRCSPDYVLASGAFSLRYPDQKEAIRRALKRSFELAKKGVGVNFLSSYTPKEQQDETTFAYVDPQMVLTLAFELTRFVQIRHDYLPNDFTVFLYH